MPQLDIASFANQVVWLSIIFVTLLTILRTTISVSYNKISHYKKHLKKLFKLTNWNATIVFLKKSWERKINKFINTFQINENLFFPTKGYDLPETLSAKKTYNLWVLKSTNKNTTKKRWNELQVFCVWFTNALKK